MEGGLVITDNFQCQTRRELLFTFSVLARVILAETEEECIRILSEMAGFLVPVSVGSEFRTFEELYPDTDLRRPVISEWDSFPGSGDSTAIGHWPFNSKLGPANSVGIFGMSSGTLGLCIAAEGTRSAGRRGADSWFLLHAMIPGWQR